MGRLPSAILKPIPYGDALLGGFKTEEEWYCLNEARQELTAFLRGEDYQFNPFVPRIYTNFQCYTNSELGFRQGINALQECRLSMGLIPLPTPP